jgi:hypothetical protein
MQAALQACWSAAAAVAADADLRVCRQRAYLWQLLPDLLVQLASF